MTKFVLLLLFQVVFVVVLLMVIMVIFCAHELDFLVGCAERNRALVVLMIWFLWYKLVWFISKLLLFVVVVIVLAMVKFLCLQSLLLCVVCVCAEWCVWV